MFSLKDEPGVTDIRNIGLAAAVELEPIPTKPGLRAFTAFEHGFNNAHLFRITGDAIAIAPPFISTESEISCMIDGLRAAIRASMNAG